MKVRIDKCTSPNSWYINQVGAELFVNEGRFDGKYELDNTGYLLNKIDCTVLQSDTQPEPKYNTDKWCIKQSLDKRICEWFNKEF